MKLVRIVPSSNKLKKYDAVFDDGKVVSFGARREDGVPYDDYLNSGNKMKREAYIARHRVNEDWTDPQKAGTLSRYILWGSSRSLSRNIQSFRNRFGL